MNDLLTKLLEWATLYGLNIIAALVIVLIGCFVANTIKSLIIRVLEKGHVDKTLVSFLSSICHIGIMIFAIIAALGRLGVQTASFVAILGAAGLAVGLALQGSLANFASGILMVIFKPFRAGDYIEGAGVAGSVQSLGIFTTELCSPDNKKIIIPNAKIMGDNIINYSANDSRRLDLVAGVSYGDDIDKVKRVLKSILENDSRVLKDPEPVIAVLQLNNSRVDFAVRPWVKTADYWPLRFALLENIKKRFDEEGISIPFPQQDIHIISEVVKS